MITERGALEAEREVAVPETELATTVLAASKHHAA
jgi:hypothetical protein